MLRHCSQSAVVGTSMCRRDRQGGGECPTLAAPPPVTRRGFHTHDGLKDANPPQPEYTALMYTMVDSRCGCLPASSTPPPNNTIHPADD